MVNEDYIKPEDRIAIEDKSSMYATMPKDQLEMEIQTNLMEHDSNNQRKYLSKIRPYETKEITEEFDQDY